MKVTATKPGYFGKLRAVGDVFEVPDGSKASWFEAEKPADDSKPARSKKAEAEKPADDLV